MKFRYQVSRLVLAALLCGVMAPYALHAQSTQDSSSSASSSTTTTPTKSKRKKKNAATTDASGASTSTAAAPASTPAPAAAPASTPAPAASAKPASSTTSAASTTKSHAASNVQAQTPPSPGMVWVNTKSGAYHKSGSRWYGKTKEGKWMTEQDATKAGYKASKD